MPVERTAYTNWPSAIAFRSKTNCHRSTDCIYRLSQPLLVSGYPDLAAKLISLSNFAKVENEKRMKRIDLYIKVEVELDEDEKPEKVANEICRVVQKLYPVRKAELSSAVPKE